MKIIILILLLPFFLKAQKLNLTVANLNGHIINYNGKNIYYVYYDNKDKRIIDSVKLEDGKFQILLPIIGYTNKFFIKLSPNDLNNFDSLNNVRIPIENSTMKLKLKYGEFSKYKLVGCSSCEIIKKFDSINKLMYEASLLHDSIIEDTTASISFKKILKITDSIAKLNYEKKWLS